MTLRPHTGQIPCAVFAMAIWATGSGFADADMIDTEGMEPWEVCGICHGHTGLSATARFPRLAGQNAAYLEKQMADFAAGHRVNEGGQMRSIITEVAPKDFSVIAAWFAEQEPPAPDVAEGDAITGALFWAKAGCGACHGKDAEPDPARPYIFAQHEDYIAKQLRDYRDGERTNDPDGVMRAQAANLTDDEISALAAFITQQVRW